MFVYYYSHGRLLCETQFTAGLVPKLMAVGAYLGGLDAVHHNDTIRSQYCQHLRHNLLEPSTVTAYEDGIGLSLLQRQGSCD